MDAVRRFAVDCGAAPEPPPLGLRVPPRTPHRGRCDDDTSGGDVPAVTIPPTWSAGKADGLLDASINPTHEKRTKPVPLDCEAAFQSCDRHLPVVGGYIALRIARLVMCCH